LLWLPTTWSKNKDHLFFTKIPLPPTSLGTATDLLRRSSEKTFLSTFSGFTASRNRLQSLPWATPAASVPAAVEDTFTTIPEVVNNGSWP
jgi:hypothetical protein